MNAAGMVRRDPTREEPPARRCSPFQVRGLTDATPSQAHDQPRTGKPHGTEADVDYHSRATPQSSMPKDCPMIKHVGGLDKSGEVGSPPAGCPVRGEPVNDAVYRAIHRPSKKRLSPGVSSRGAPPLQVVVIHQKRLC
ncbi:hypothetical protein CSOJ01_14759 [Colletotrichum sojae]|uniref:Uncharacterized protein n=1 Tax=Colletotrichum sojae TaxID=2175907 RepID=A0A8H6IPM6_9PEZI|nr:hypothetical protein CSOJ01_14759 [Colletotrichum sojae]